MLRQHASESDLVLWGRRIALNFKEKSFRDRLETLQPPCPQHGLNCIETSMHPGCWLSFCEPSQVVVFLFDLMLSCRVLSTWNPGLM